MFTVLFLWIREVDI